MVAARRWKSPALSGRRHGSGATGTGGFDAAKAPGDQGISRTGRPRIATSAAFEGLLLHGGVLIEQLHAALR